MDFRWSTELEHIAELIKGKLYFAVTYSEKAEPIKNTNELFYFNIDDEFIYLNYYMDFGPLNISCLYKYCAKLHTFMQCAQMRRIVHYTSSNTNKRVNSAYLIGSYCVVFLSMDPKLVYKKLLDAGGTYKPFIDASQGISRYTLKLLECLQGIYKAYILNFIDFDDFSVSEYDLYDKIQNGDFNWLVPRKFLALIGPIDKEVSPNGHSPSFYIKFASAGIEHHDLFFPDGTTPPKHILLKFLQIAESTNGAIAVHCKAGLGRTGSLIGAYIMKHYQFTAKEAIAWMRICRPGSVIGQQQGWLEKIEPWLWKEGRVFRLHQYGDGDKLPHHKYGIYSKTWQLNRRKFLQGLQRRTLSEGPNYQIPNIPRDEQQVMRIKAQEKKALSNKENIIMPKRFKQMNSVSDQKTQGDKLNDIKLQKYYNSFLTKHSNLSSNSRVPYGSNTQSGQPMEFNKPMHGSGFRTFPNIANQPNARKAQQPHPSLSVSNQGRVAEIAKKFNYYANVRHD